MCVPLRAVGRDSSGGRKTIQELLAHSKTAPPPWLCCGLHQQIQVPMPECAPAVLLWGQWNLLPFVPSQCVLPDGDIPCGVAIRTQVLSEASPAGLALGSAGPVLHSPCPRHGGALPLEGLPPKAAGTEMLQFPAPLIGAAGLARIRLGRITPLRCQISHPQGLCSRSPMECTVMSPSWH